MERPSGAPTGPAVPGRGASGRPSAAPPWEQGCYWILYAVATPGAWVHWLSGDHLLAFGCAAAALCGVHMLTRGRT